jgi:tetratricopeptide (TPR) repeat protein
MLKKLWQWLKKLWYKLRGSQPEKIVTQASSSSRSPKKSSQQKDYEQTSNSSGIKDKDLEFLFNQLLEGVANGWQQRRVEQFFQKLEHRVSINEWLKWMKRFEGKIMSSPAPNYRLAAKMVLLGEVSTSLPFVRSIGDLANTIGQNLLNQHSDNLLSESLSFDLAAKIASQEQNLGSSETSGPENTYLVDIINRLQTDSEFAAETARNLGLKTIEPSLIVQKLLEKEEKEKKQFSGAAIQETSVTSPPDESAADELQNLFKMGLEKAQAGDLEGAIACWDKILAQDSRIAQAWHNRGSALAYLNRFQEAVASFDRAISLNVNDYQSWDDRGTVLYNLKRWEEALISWDRVVTIEPSYYQAWYNRGLALEKLTLIEEALESYERALEIEPNFQLAKKRQNQLLDLLTNSGNSEEATGLDRQ